MSKRRHKNRQEVSSTSNNRNNMNSQQQMNYNNPFGINPNQLLSMFGNIDMNQINSMLQSMGADGFDFNNFNLGSIQNLMNGMGRNNTQQQQNQQNNNQWQTNNFGDNQKQNLDTLNNFDFEDDNIQLLNSFRNIVGEEKKEFIDKIIKLYNEGAFED
jgi:hypothetical protein